MKILGVIPARLASTRLPGKVLLDIHGYPLIAWVYAAARRSPLFTELIVATDSQEVLDVCRDLAIPAEMTSVEHRCGSDRLNEIMSRHEADVYANIQGDEPMLSAEHLDLLLRPFADGDNVQVTTLMTPIDNEAAADPNNVKVVTDVHGNAIYFSRWPIPYDRDQKAPVSRYKHIGLYAYRAEALRLFHSLKPSSLELAENLEQLRYLENGVPIHVALTHSNTVGVDTQSDLVRVRGLLAGKSPL